MFTIQENSPKRPAKAKAPRLGSIKGKTYFKSIPVAANIIRKKKETRIPRPREDPVM